MEKNLAALCNTLKSTGLKLTPARKIMLNIFLIEDQKLYRAQEIYDEARNLSPKIHYSTIYRNLDILLRHRIIDKIEIEGAASYILFEQPSHGHRMICTLCHRTEPLPYCPVKEMETSLFQNGKGFLPLRHRVEIFGVCAKCQKNNLPQTAKKINPTAGI